MVYTKIFPLCKGEPGLEWSQPYETKQSYGWLTIWVAVLGGSYTFKLSSMREFSRPQKYSSDHGLWSTAN